MPRRIFWQGDRSGGVLWFAGWWAWVCVVDFGEGGDPKRRRDSTAGV